MRNLHLLDAFRDTSREVVKIWGFVGDETCGAFFISSPIDKALMRVIASSGEGWDHVSVSRPNRCPNWPEMDHIKRLFFKDEETAMQLHVPPSENISFHPYCLHLWAPHPPLLIPRPPAEFVGPTEARAA